MEPWNEDGWEGQQVGHFTLQACIRITRMSTVYKACDILNKFPTPISVVIKVATNSPERPELINFLKNEEEILRQLDHPGIVRLFDSGYIGESYFLALEFLEGSNLSDYLFEGSFSYLYDIVSWLVDVLDALEYLHKMGFVHGDIKLENLMRTSSGVKIIDFALATQASSVDDSAGSGTGPKVIFGTPPYMPPEQWIDDGYLDGRVDIFALGVVLYELLTGKTPFPTFKPGEPIKNISEGYWNTRSVELPDSIPQEVREMLEDIIWEATQPERDLRFSTAQDMREALSAALPLIEEVRLKQIAEDTRDITQPLVVPQL